MIYGLKAGKVEDQLPTAQCGFHSIPTAVQLADLRLGEFTQQLQAARLDSIVDVVLEQQWARPVSRFARGVARWTASLGQHEIQSV